MRAVPWRLSVKGEQAASRGRKLVACLGLRRLDALEEDRGRVAEDERRTEAERPDQLGTLASRRAAVRADVRTVVLLVAEHRPPSAGAVGDAPAGFSVEPEAAGGRGRIGCEKTLPGGDFFLFRCVVRSASSASSIPPSFSRALSKANSSRGGLRSGADRRGPASIPSRKTSPHSKQLTTSSTGAAAGRALVGALRQDASKGPVRRPLSALRIDAAPYAGNGPLKGVKPDRRKALLLLVGRLSRRTRHRRDEIGQHSTP